VQPTYPWSNAGLYTHAPTHRMHDVGKSKAIVAAERINSRVAGVNVVAHHCRIEEKPAEFYKQFTLIVLGLDSLEARRFMNSTICSFLGASSCSLAISTTGRARKGVKPVKLVILNNMPYKVPS